MGRIKKIKNTTISDKTWNGQIVKPSEYCELSSNDLDLWKNDPDVRSSISGGTAIIAIDNTDYSLSGDSISNLDFDYRAQDVFFSSGTTISGQTVQYAIDQLSNMYGKLPYNSINASGTTTTTSSSYVVIPSMTITPGAGKYIVLFSSNINESTSNSTVYVSIYGNGSVILNSERITQFISTTGTFNISNNAIVTVEGAQTIEARWKTSFGTATIGNRILTLLKIE